MPRVNINFEPVPEVAPTGAPGNDYFHIQADPAAFGAPGTKGLQTLGQGVEHTAEAGFELAQFFGRVNVDDQTNKFIDARNRILYGDPNKQTIGPDGKPSVDRGFMGLEGRAASDQRQATLQALQDARTAGLANLTSPRDRLAYDTETRRMYAEAEGHVGQHTDNQWKVWAQGVNHAGANHELDSFVNSLDDPAKARGYAQNFINFRVQQAQLKFGDDPQIKEEAAAEARRDLLEAHVNAVAVRDPAGAVKLLDDNKSVAGIKYDDMRNRLRARAENQTGVTAANKYVMAATGGGIGPPMSVARGDVANSAAAAWRAQGMSGNGVAGILYNINEESGFNPTLRHPDQPRFAPDDERHYAHGLYQEGAEEWARYDGWLKANHPGADWRDARLQSEFAAWNLKTNYPGTWARMNAAATPEQAAAIYAREYLRPAAANLQSRLAKIDRGIGSAESYGAGGATYTPAVVTAGGLPAAAAAAPAGPPPLHEQLANALRAAEADPELSDRERDIAVQHIERQFRILEITENQKASVKKEAANRTASGYVTELAELMHSPNPDFVALAGRIAHDPALDAEPHIKENLLDRIKHVSGEEQALAYGPGYLQAREALFSPPDAPGHINDFSQLVTRPDITEAGLRDLHTRLGLVKGDVDHGAVERRMNSYLQFAKKELSFEEDNGFFKLRDPKGEAIYSGQFEPDFVKRVSDLAQDAQRTGDRKKLDDFLSIDNVSKMIRGYRDKREMDREKAFASGEARGEQGAPPQQPLPPTPADVNPAGWVPIVQAPPMTAGGKPWPLANWAQVLQKLHDDPSEENKAAFDERFGKTGLTADKVLEKFKQQEGEPEAKPGTAASPAASVTDWIHSGFNPDHPGNPLAFIGERLHAVVPVRTAEEERAALDVREYALKRSGLKGAFLDAQMKRIADRRAELDAMKQ